MLVLVGALITLFAVFGGFMMAGGHLAVLLQPVELLMIAGGAAGAFVLGNTGKSLKATLSALPKIFRSPVYTKAMYMELLALLYEILLKIKKDGMMAIEQDIEDPENSPLFAKYPKIQQDRHAMDFLTDYLRLMVMGTMNAFEIENLMENEIDTHHHEGEVPIQAIQKVGDGLPAFGIVAAVMGVVHTMQSVHLPPSELGILIARALVGTFLGILLAYGFVSPVAGTLQLRLDESTKFYQCIKVTLLASLNGYAPAIAVEFGRKVLYSHERPTFSELEAHVRQERST